MGSCSCLQLCAQTHLDYSVRIISIRRRKKKRTEQNKPIRNNLQSQPSDTICAPHNVSWSSFNNTIIHRIADRIGMGGQLCWFSVRVCLVLWTILRFAASCFLNRPVNDMTALSRRLMNAFLFRLPAAGKASQVPVSPVSTSMCQNGKKQKNGFTKYLQYIPRHGDMKRTCCGLRLETIRIWTRRVSFGVGFRVRYTGK